jgi:hypothetical protein
MLTPGSTVPPSPSTLPARCTSGSLLYLQNLPTEISHVCGHTLANSTPSNLNRLADFLTLSMHHRQWIPPAVPVLTFMMDKCTPYNVSLGYLESLLTAYMDQRSRSHTPS